MPKQAGNQPALCSSFFLCASEIHSSWILLFVHPSIHPSVPPSILSAKPSTPSRSVGSRNLRLHSAPPETRLDKALHCVRHFAVAITRTVAPATHTRALIAAQTACLRLALAVCLATLLLKYRCSTGLGRSNIKKQTPFVIAALLQRSPTRSLACPPDALLLHWLLSERVTSAICLVLGLSPTPPLVLSIVT